MDLNYSDEQVALKDSAERYLRERYTARSRIEPGSHWKAFADLGWLGIAIDPAYDGLGGTMVDVGLIAESLGRHLCVEPYISSVVFAGSLIEQCAGADRRTALLNSLAGGDDRFAVAHEEPGRGPDAASIQTMLGGDGATATITGAKTTVIDAGLASSFLVTARRRDGAAAIALCRCDAKGLSAEMFPTVDGRTAARLRLDATPVDVISGPGDVSAGIDLGVDRAVAVLAADVTGTMQAALDATVAYAKIRVQFGQPIGANQVVKHRLVEMAVKCEEARSIALKALILAGESGDAATRSRAVSAAKIKISKAARSVCEEAIQLHGGMGVTEELEVGGYLKRALAFEAVLGTSRWHKQRYAASRGAIDS